MILARRHQPDRVRHLVKVPVLCSARSNCTEPAPPDPPAPLCPNAPPAPPVLYAIKHSDGAVDRAGFMRTRPRISGSIRDAMARAAEFTAVPGWGGALMGATAIGAAAISGPPDGSRRWLPIWLADAALAASIGLVAMTMTGAPPGHAAVVRGTGA